MSNHFESLKRALALVDKAHGALADAATVLQDTFHEDLSDSAIHLEAQACILSVQVQRALRTGDSRYKSLAS